MRHAFRDGREGTVEIIYELPPLIAVSAKTGRGIDRLLDRIERQFEKHVRASRPAS